MRAHKLNTMLMIRGGLVLGRGLHLTLKIIFQNSPRAKGRLISPLVYSPTIPRFQSTTSDMSKSAPTTVHGSCLCNAIQYTVTGNDRGPILCHCSNCQKVTGSTFANNLRFMKSKLTFKSGEDKLKAHKDSNTKSGNTLSRYFCGECGSPIYLTNPEFEGLVVLYSGCLESEQKNTKPRGELFAENRRSWFNGVEGAAKL